MFTHSIIHRSLMTAFVLSIAGVAFARQPPALTKAQRAAEHAAICEGRVQPGSSYRAMVRFGPAAQASAKSVAKAGYRDSVKRFGTGPAASEFACEHPRRAPRTSASL
jgi:hypothetical protein